MAVKWNCKSVFKVRRLLIQKGVSGEILVFVRIRCKTGTPGNFLVNIQAFLSFWMPARLRKGFVDCVFGFNV